MNLTSTRRSQNVAEGGWARVMSADGHIWSARVTYVSGELVGLRGETIVDGRFAENDKVTVLVGIRRDPRVDRGARVASVGNAHARRPAVLGRT